MPANKALWQADLPTSDLSVVSETVEWVSVLHLVRSWLCHTQDLAAPVLKPLRARGSSSGCQVSLMGSRGKQKSPL